MGLLFSNNCDIDFCGFLSLDATFSDGLGRLVNDDPLYKANCAMKKIKGGNKVYLVLCALRNIEKGEELRYDYGVKDLPWRQLKGIIMVTRPIDNNLALGGWCNT